MGGLEFLTDAVHGAISLFIGEHEIVDALAVGPVDGVDLDEGDSSARCRRHFGKAGREAEEGREEGRGREVDGGRSGEGRRESSRIRSTIGWSASCNTVPWPWKDGEKRRVNPTL
jgi:hypothetical protein